MNRDPLTEQINACEIEVHRALGPGLNEPVYESVMPIENFTSRDWSSNGNQRFQRVYRDVRIGTYRPDFIVSNAVIVEIKAVSTVAPVFKAQVLTTSRLPVSTPACS